MSDAWVIWSYEHNAWWRPGRMGYTTLLTEAGRYTADEASEIVHHANEFSRSVQERAVRLRDAEEYRHRGWHCLTPGAYDDHKGVLHIVIPEMLTANGYPDTPENRATLLAAVDQLWTGVIQIED